MDPTGNSQYEVEQPTKINKKKNINTIIVILAIVIILVLLFIILSGNKQSNINWIDVMTDPKNLVKIAKE